MLNVRGEPLRVLVGMSENLWDVKVTGTGNRVLQQFLGDVDNLRFKEIEFYVLSLKSLIPLE